MNGSRPKGIGYPSLVTDRGLDLRGTDHAGPGRDSTQRPAPPVAGSAFLLAQLGAHAAAVFASRVSRLGLTPALTGVLRSASMEPGLSQRTLAARLSVVPSKVVQLIDDLEQRGLVERRSDDTDRRNRAIYLTDNGAAVLAEVATIAMQHENDMTAALDADERSALRSLLQRVADEQGLAPGVHPGYKALRPTGHGLAPD